VLVYSNGLYHIPRILSPDGVYRLIWDSNKKGLGWVVDEQGPVLKLPPFPARAKGRMTSPKNEKPSYQERAISAATKMFGT
jgi:hypothetical protein